VPYKLLLAIFALRARQEEEKKPNAPINDVRDGPIRGCAGCRYRLGVLWRAARESASERANRDWSRWTGVGKVTPTM
jgi:hypothetical protein